MLDQFLDDKGLIDKKKALNGLPLVVKSLLGPAIDWLNGLDMDNNKTPDVVQFMPVLIALFHLGVAVTPHVDLGKFKAWFLAHDFIKDQKAVSDIITKAGELITATTARLQKK